MIKIVKKSNIRSCNGYHKFEENSFLSMLSTISLGLFRDNPCSYFFSIDEIAFILDRTRFVIWETLKEAIWLLKDKETLLNVYNLNMIRLV